jgi:cytochrome c-type biogenesis protein
MEFIYEGLAGLEAISPYLYLLVFLGGVISALSICYVPILVMFGGYMSGHAKDGTDKALRISISFTLGMMVTSAVIGIIAAFIGKSIMNLFTGYGLDVWIPAVIGILVGLQLLGILNLKMPKTFHVQAKKPKTMLGSFNLGLPFGLVITPCTIPIFFMIITYVAVNGSLWHGAFLLAVYALGKGVVLVIVSVSSVAFLKDMATHWSKRLEKTAGIILIAASLYLIFFQVKMPIP